jgi:hypothetical protein
VAIVALCAVLIVGVKVGEYFEHQKFELAKALSVVQADEYMAAGNFEAAIPVLHFTKAYDSRRGSSDVLLAKAYVGNGEPCLAQAFADSHLRYMERNNLTPLSSYASTQALYERASQECAKVMRAFASSASTAK